MSPISHPRFGAARAIVVVAFALPTFQTALAATPPAEWRFTVRLDGKAIGTHRFLLSSIGDSGLSLSSQAQYDVTFLGVPLYRYRHRADERWNGGCLERIEARTEDNGRLAEVRGLARDGRFELQVREDGRPAPAAASPAGCLMSFAYWNPAIAVQRRLLDPGSGRVEAVTISMPGTVPEDLAAEASPVRGLRIGGLAQPIDVWYAGERWVGLDTVVGGGRRLSYRLR